MCEYCCDDGRDLARIDLEDDGISVAHVNIRNNSMKLRVETDIWVHEVEIDTKFCPKCGRCLFL